MLGPVAAKRSKLRLPRFLHGEDVRVLGLTGSETNYDGELVDVEGLVGATLTVSDARPTNRRDGLDDRSQHLGPLGGRLG